MKIDRIELKNFRQFFGDQKLELATDPKKNVTLIHAENGVGKTTILNSILWALFGEVTTKFEQPDKIINFEALKEGKKSATASVHFDVDGKAYVAQRHFSSNGEEKQSVFRVDDGVSRVIPAPETFINSIMPREMARYFFFDGEAAERFSAETNNKEISRAIRSMLGCDLAETAITDLKAIAKSIDDQLASLPGEDELREHEKELRDAEEDVEKETKKKSEIEKDIATFRSQLEEVIRKLRETEAARQFQARREEKQAALRQTNLDIQAEQAEIVRWIGQRSIQLVSKKLAKETLDFIDEASLKGRIPAPYNKEFVSGLLHAESCICDRPLKAGTTEWNAVTSLLKTASNAILMGRVVQARARIQQLREGAIDAPRLLEAAQKKLGELTSRRNALEQQIEELGRTIQGLPVSEIAEREKARKALADKISSKNQDLGVVKSRLQQAEHVVREKNAEISRSTAKSDRTRRLLTRRNLLHKSSEYLKATLATYESEARGVIQKQTNAILDRVARKDYRCRFNEDFSLELLKADGQPAPKSSGENQLLSLTFIASLVQFSELRSKASGHILQPGTIAPLVLDSPFGVLDDTYQEMTADFIPKMASQVVLLVSSSQGDASVLKALAPHIGAEYVLVSENRGTRNGKPEDRKILRNREYVCSLYGMSRDMTRIERVV